MSSTSASAGRTFELFSRLSADSVTIVLLVYAAAVFLSFGTESFQLKIVPDFTLGLALIAIVYWLSKRVRRQEQTLIPAGKSLPLLIVAGGLVVRIGFGLLVHPVPDSDMASYESTARHLVSTGDYVCMEGGFSTRAYRPPGVAFLLASVMKIVGPQSWAALLLNCALFLFSSLFLWLSIRELPWQSGAWALGMLALWPSDMMMASLSQSETPSVLVSALLIYVVAHVRRPVVKIVLLGIVTGLSCLLRNSNLVMLGVWLFVVVQIPVLFWKRVAFAALLLVCAFAPILPWTLRNYHVLGSPVLVATNGGDNFYSANNPLSGGGWEGTSSAQLQTYLPDEVAMDKAGYRLAKEWIRSHPVAFLRLGIEKIRILFGSDDWGPYWALERGRGNTGGWYKASLVGAALWWIAVWGLLLMNFFRNISLFRTDSTVLAIAAFTLLPALLFFVFQSQPRYHAFMIPGLLWLGGRSLFAR